MIHIYGIPNCDTVQKAIKWLNAHKVAYTFHNFREEGISKSTLETWLKHFPADKLINTRSTTYRSLTDEEKKATGSEAKAIALMMEHHSIIKRPVWDFGNGTYLLGWDEAKLSELAEL